jgi:cytoskeletal protein CcmA (bactofilin family)
VIVIGRVTGNVHGTERVEVQGSGIIDGDVASPRLIVAEGAVLNGAIEMMKQSDGTAAAAPAAKAATPDVRKVG